MALSTDAAAAAVILNEKREKHLRVQSMLALMPTIYNYQVELSLDAHLFFQGQTRDTASPTAVLDTGTDAVLYVLALVNLPAVAIHSFQQASRCCQ